MGQGWGECCLPCQQPLDSVKSVAQLCLCRAMGIWEKSPLKHPINFAQKQLSRTLRSPVKALRLVCNAIISSAIAAVQLSEHISKWIARHSALVHTGAPAVMRTQLLLGHTQNRAAGEQWHRIQRRFLTLSLSCGISLVLNLITEDFQVSKM